MTISLDELLVWLGIGEDVDFEVKEAVGGFPNDFWPTYSAFANTQGGVIVLGVREIALQTFEFVGLAKPEARRKELWDLLQNREKVSVNLVGNDDVTVEVLDGRKVLIVRVPQASRKQRPVYINGNPMRGTYKRGYEGDYRCDEDEVRRMLRDASDDVFDTRIFRDFTIADLDPATLTAYRNRFRTREGDHPWLALSDREFLEKLGGWRKDRERSEEGLTLAGLLMFGREGSIAEALPHFRLDYQERFSDDPEVRWTHRITQDGRWEANLFNFYSRVINRLIQDLNVPFKLDKDLMRLGETHVHEALREALVNCLIHADHSSTRNILVLKARPAFVFANPGRLRLPLEQVYAGGVSDCRNPNLQKMFFMMGAGERAGSGIGKILRAWREQEWLMPIIQDRLESEITECWLPTMSMIPETVLADLEARLGPGFRSADELERTALVMAHQFGMVTNTELQRYRPEHPAEIGKTLRGLVNRGWFSKHDRGRATRYRLAGEAVGGTSMLDFGLRNIQHRADDIQHKAGDIQHKAGDIQHKTHTSQQSATGFPSWQSLEALAAPIRGSKRMSPHAIDEVIVQLCTQKALTAKQIAVLIGRELSTLSVHYLPRMVREGRLRLLYPEHPRRPDQAYLAGEATSGITFPPGDDTDRERSGG